MNVSPNKYRVNLLRVWRAGALDLGWRASLEKPRTGQRIGFATLEQLVAYLMEQVERDEKGAKLE